VRTLLHFSDVHVSAGLANIPLKDCLGKRVVGAANLLLRRSRAFARAPEKLAALTRFSADQGVDSIICTGDYTALGTDAEFASSRELIQGLIDSVPCFATVPGNHDLYVPDTVREQRFEKHYGELLTTDRAGWCVDGPWPSVRFLGDDLALVGVNSARPNPSIFRSSGRIPETQIAALEDVLRQPELDGRWVFVFTHYGPLTGRGLPDSHHHGLENYEELLRVTGSRPRTAVLHGHIHHGYHLAAEPGRPWLFCAGSATYESHEALWMFRVGDGEVEAVPGVFTDAGYQLQESASVRL